MIDKIVHMFHLFRVVVLVLLSKLSMMEDFDDGNSKEEENGTGERIKGGSRVQTLDGEQEQPRIMTKNV